MKICNFGSMNLDHVYQVDMFLQPGETKSSRSLFTNCGGKGLNQSIAAAKAGNQVVHAGVIGSGGEMLEEVLAKNGVDVSLLSHCLLYTSFSGGNDHSHQRRGNRHPH